MVTTPKQEAQRQKPQGHRRDGLRTSRAASRGVGKESAGRALTVYYSPNAVPSREHLSGIKADWRLVSPQNQVSGSGRSKGFYLTTIDDLISDLVGRNRIAQVGTGAGYRGILIHSSKASSGLKDQLVSLLSCSQGGDRRTPWLASSSIRVIRRVLQAQRHGHGDAVIASAFVDGRMLVVQDANLDMHVIAADDHPVLSTLTTDQLSSFSIDPAGSGLHWRSLDLDLDLDGLSQDSKDERADYRLKRGRVLRLWLEQYPEVMEKRNEDLMNSLKTVMQGKSDLSSQLAVALAEVCAITPNALLNELAELQNTP
jgi:hypothetical protein